MHLQETCLLLFYLVSPGLYLVSPSLFSFNLLFLFWNQTCHRVGFTVFVFLWVVFFFFFIILIIFTVILILMLLIFIFFFPVFIILIIFIIFLIVAFPHWGSVEVFFIKRITSDNFACFFGWFIVFLAFLLSLLFHNQWTGWHF